MKAKEAGLLRSIDPDYDYADSYEYIIIDPENKTDILDIAQMFIEPGPKWVEGLFALRNRIASVFKLKTPASIRRESNGPTWETGTQAGIFKVFTRSETEIILGKDDRHLNLRVSLRLEQGGHPEKKITVTTFVWLNNRLGKIYFFIIRPFHRTIVPILLKRKLRRLQSAVNTQKQ